MNALYGCINSATCPNIPGISRADVDADGAVTMRDALIIHSYVVGGVDVSRFRVGQGFTGTSAMVRFPSAGTGSTIKPQIDIKPGTP